MANLDFTRRKFVLRSRPIFPALFAIMLAAPATAPAQTVTLEDLEEERLLRSGIANVVPALALFGVTEGPRYARFELDAGILGQVEADLLKIPVSHSFPPRFRGIRPHAQITFGGVAIDKGVNVALIPAFPTRIDAKLRGFAAVAGAGATIPLGEATTIRPLLLGGYAQIRSDATTSGPFSGLLLSLAEGLVEDASVESVIAGASLEIRHRARRAGRRPRWRPSLRPPQRGTA